MTRTPAGSLDPLSADSSEPFAGIEPSPETEGSISIGRDDAVPSASPQKGRARSSGIEQPAEIEVPSMIEQSSLMERSSAAQKSPRPKPRAQSRIIAALDLPTADEALALATTLKGTVGLVKIGLELFVSEGPEVVKRIRDRGLDIFLDLKLHDIPNTVEQAARAAARMGVSMLTIHASGGAEMIAAAKRGVQAGAKEAGHNPPILLAVTVLTSMNDSQLSRLGIAADSKSQVLRLGSLAVKAGADGLVCSAHELRDLREQLGDDPVLVVPGIRPSGSSADDQARVATPAKAVEWGADFLVIGRPIRHAPDPAGKAQEIGQELD